jgi:hypothetical protein
MVPPSIVKATGVCAGELAVIKVVTTHMKSGVRKFLPLQIFMRLSP